MDKTMNPLPYGHGIPVKDFCKVCENPKPKRLDDIEIVIGHLKATANFASKHGFENFKIWRGCNMALLSMSNSSVNTGYVAGYELVGKQWIKLDGWITTLDICDPEDEARKLSKNALDVKVEDYHASIH